MSKLKQVTGIPRKVVGLLGVLLWLGGTGVMLQWILADASDVYLYAGVVLIFVSGLVITSALLDYQFEEGEFSDSGGDAEQS